ncbi:MAG: hypothetical protein K2X39_05175 [Silvanigrellaceae bacterium]|nr:hypothetical protein [Silvanigrellaceae bacterium]
MFEPTSKLSNLDRFLDKPFQREAIYLYDCFRLSHKVEPIRHYNGLIPIPRSPCIHPYNPTGDTEDQVEQYGGYPVAIAAVKLPKNVVNNLFPTIKQAITLANIGIEKISFFFVTQNMPWKENTVLLFRPHYWVHGAASLNNVVNNHTLHLDTPCRVGVFSENNANLSCDGVQNVLSNNLVSVCSHPGVDFNLNIPMIICSPQNTVLSGINCQQTNSFYSMVLTNDGQLAVTLHWLLNSEDQTALACISAFVETMRDFIREIKALPNSSLTVEKGPLSALVALLDPNMTLVQEVSLIANDLQQTKAHLHEMEQQLENIIILLSDDEIVDVSDEAIQTTLGEAINLQSQVAELEGKIDININLSGEKGTTARIETWMHEIQTIQIKAEELVTAFIDDQSRLRC